MFNQKVEQEKRQICELLCNARRNIKTKTIDLDGKNGFYYSKKCGVSGRVMSKKRQKNRKKNTLFKISQTLKNYLFNKKYKRST